uniref:DH domain-containing protein n=1 Tax=Mucochytrium quahogii TaxID=96639 RepID=A0A7S2RJF4_9STRA|mmetsp:Transcript_910/g.1019  ORF Transcript_910/g.1019 Transcript_910/m.1019 type:complete len:653 (-) Transcript_910:728-2686(-)
MDRVRRTKGKKQPKARQLSKLVGLVPCLLSFLRDVDINSGDLLLEDGVNITDEVYQFLHQIICSMSVDSDVSIGAIKQIISAFPSQVCAIGVRMIVTEAEPSLVPPSIGAEIASKFEILDKCETAKGCALVVGPYLDKLPTSRYYALAELCAFLRDRCTDPTEAACICGPAILGVAKFLEGDVGKASRDAAGLFEMFIDDCDIIFGRMCAKTSQASLGERRNRTTVEKNKSLSRAESEEETKSKSAFNVDSLDNTHIQQLAGFYKCRDKDKADRIHRLFDFHDFVSIARALYEKFGGDIPPGWAVELREMQALGIQNLEWFTDAENQNCADPKSRRLSRRVSILGNLAFNSLVEDGSSIVRPSDGEKADRVIDEIIDTEHSYHDSLAAAVEFGEHIRKIALGESGKAAEAQLGLSSGDIETILGYRLGDILKLSKALLAHFEVIDIIRTQPKPPHTRVDIVIDAMLEIVEEFHVYSPYVSCHKVGQTIIRNAKKVRKAKTKKQLTPKRMMSSPSDGAKRAHKGGFEEVWYEFTATNHGIKGQELNSILIMPIQRIPRFELLFKQLAKSIQPGHPAMEKLEHLCSILSEIAQQLNQALRQHEKISALLGVDELVPTGSGMRRMSHPSGLSTTSKANKVFNRYHAGTCNLNELV